MDISYIIITGLVTGISFAAGYFLASKKFVEIAFVYKKKAEFFSMLVDVCVEELLPLTDRTQDELESDLSHKLEAKVKAL